MNGCGQSSFTWTFSNLHLAIAIKKGEAKTTIVLAKQTVVLAVLQVCPVEDTQVLFKGASTCDCNEVNVRGLLFCAQRLL